MQTRWNVSEQRGIFRWSGTEGIAYEVWRPFAVEESKEFPVCDGCGVAIDYLLVERRLPEEVQEDLEFMRDWIMEISMHGHHRMPLTGEFAPGHELPIVPVGES